MRSNVTEAELREEAMELPELDSSETEDRLDRLMRPLTWMRLGYHGIIYPRWQCKPIPSNGDLLKYFYADCGRTYHFGGGK